MIKLTEKAMRALEEIAAAAERTGDDEALKCMAYEAEGMRKALALMAEKRSA